MAGKVKKGFGIYLFLLLLALVAAFLIVVLVMIFSPFKNVLGYQYFFYNAEGDKAAYEYNVTGGNADEAFDFSSLDEIKINCNYASVEVIKTIDIDHDCVRITNSAKGFSKANWDVDFSYNIYYEDNAKKILCIDVQEATGFVFFSKNVVISICIPRTARANHFADTNLNISNTSGDISLGMHEEKYGTIQFNSVDIKTNSGTVHMSSNLSSSFESLFISSSSGRIKAWNDINVSSSLSINSNRGDIDLENVTCLNDAKAKLSLGSSQFYAKTMIGEIDLIIKDGYFDVDKLQGDLSGNDTAQKMTSARITIKDITGNVSFPFANNAKIVIDQMNTDSNLYIHGTGGSIKVNSLNGRAWIEMTTGSVDVTTYKDIEVTTTKGNINVKYLGTSISDAIDLVSSSGKVNLGVLESLAYELSVFNSKGQMRDSRNVTIEGFSDAFELPLKINNGTKEINIQTNSSVNVNLVKSL